MMIFKFICSVIAIAFTAFSLTFNDKEINARSLHIVKKLGGGKYDRELQAIIPLNPQEVKRNWVELKNQIAHEIGPLYPRPSRSNADWKNTARTVEQLLKDAQSAALLFKQGCLQIAEETNSRTYFGMGDKEIVKSETSLSRKVIQDASHLNISQSEAVTKIRDALRGTLIANTPKQVPLIAKGIQDFVSRQGGEVIFRNFWEEERADGYVGVHAKILLPFFDQEQETVEKKYVIAEIQIHLRSIMDGTKKSAKEREHKIYEKLRKEDFDTETISSASMLLYLTGIKACL